MKGFAILLVIFGHFFGLKVISIFHMPLWYVLSGYFFRHENFLLSAKNNARRLLIPYFCVCAIITLSFFVIDTNKAFCFLNQALLGEPIKNNLGVMLGPVWFLLSLFWCKWIYNVASIKFSNNSILGLSFLLTAIVVVLTPYTDYSIYPFFISTVPIGVFFYSIGVKWRESNKCIFPEFRYPFVVSVVIAVFLTYFQIKEPRFNMSLTILSFFPLCLVNAYLYTYILYCICLKISNIRILGGGKMVWTKFYRHSFISLLGILYFDANNERCH